MSEQDYSRFDLETAIATWRQFHAHRRVFRKEDLDELERHLRDHTAHLVARRLGEQAAFREAVQRLGDLDGGEAEYGKVYWGKLRRRREITAELTWRITLLTSYFTIALRNYKRQKLYAFINVFGLALGMAAFWLILQQVTYEWSYDAFHVDKASLYRVHYRQYKEGVLEIDNAAAVPAVGPAMKDNFPQVVEYARLVAFHPVVVASGTRRYREEKIRGVDPSFLRMFTFPLLKGDAATALAAPNTAVITETTALKYFGTGDPIGKVIVLDGTREVEIRGICGDVPPTSHLTFDFLISLDQHKRGKGGDDDWYSYDFYTYIQLAPGADPTALQDAFNSWVARERNAGWEQERLRQTFDLEPITRLHLYSHRMQELESGAQGDGRTVYFLLVIGVLVLTISWANYINLTTARSTGRAKEIGVRKVLGAHGAQLKGQFLMEAALLNGIAAAIGVGLAWAAAPWFERLTGHPLHTLQPSYGGVWLGTILVGALLSGSYPALVLARLKPVTALQGYTRSITGGIRLRSSLVTFQFVISMILIAGTFIVYRQLAHLRAKDLGVQLEHMLIVSGPGISGVDSVYTHTLQAFKTELLKLGAVRQVTVSSSVPGREIHWMNTITRASTHPSGVERGQLGDKAIFIVGVDPDYVPAYAIELLAGRNFSEAFRLDQDALLLNRAATRLLGYTSPQEAIGQRVDFRGNDRVVIGVVDDYNHVSPKTAVDPVVFTYQPAARGYFSAKVDPSDVHQTVEQVKRLYLSFFPGNPFDYYFLDEAFNHQYQADLHFGRFFGAFAGLAILVACLGLFGLAAFAAEQRTKEIGIRKVLGASTSSIVGLFSTDFLKLVGLAFLVAVPLAYFAMQRWLEGFAYRIEIGPGVFLLTGTLVLLIALIPVSYQAIRAALADPVKSLRYE